MIGLVKADSNTLLGAVSRDFLAEGRIGARAVEGGLTDAQHIQIRAIDHQNVHGKKFLSTCCAASSAEAALSITTSAVETYRS